MLHNKFWQGFFALAPIITVVLAIVAYIFFIFTIFGQISELERSGGPPDFFLQGMGAFIILIFAAVFLALGSLIFYIMHAVQNPNLKENNLLIVWILLFIFVGGIGQLVYWIVEILNKNQREVTPS